MKKLLFASAVLFLPGLYDTVTGRLIVNKKLLNEFPESEKISRHVFIGITNN